MANTPPHRRPPDGFSSRPARSMGVEAVPAPSALRGHVPRPSPRVDPATFLLRQATVFHDLSRDPYKLDMTSVGILLYVASLGANDRSATVTDVVSFGVSYGCTLTVRKRLKRLLAEDYLKRAATTGHARVSYAVTEKTEALLLTLHADCLHVAASHLDLAT